MPCFCLAKSRTVCCAVMSKYLNAAFFAWGNDTACFAILGYPKHLQACGSTVNILPFSDPLLSRLTLIFLLQSTYSNHRKMRLRDEPAGSIPSHPTHLQLSCSRLPRYGTMRSRPSWPWQAAERDREIARLTAGVGCL